MQNHTENTSDLMEKFEENDEIVQQMSKDHDYNSVFSFGQRLHVIHLNKSHRLSAKEIAEKLSMKYSTVRSIVMTYEKDGRINKLLTKSAKKSILQVRTHRMSLLKYQK